MVKIKKGSCNITLFGVSPFSTIRYFDTFGLVSGRHLTCKTPVPCIPRCSLLEQFRDKTKRQLNNQVLPVKCSLCQCVFVNNFLLHPFYRSVSLLMFFGICVFRAVYAVY